MSNGVLAVGAAGDDVNFENQGSVHIFTLGDSWWGYTQKLAALNSKGYDMFGTSVTMSNGVLAVGAAGHVVCVHFHAGR